MIVVKRRVSFFTVLAALLVILVSCSVAFAEEAPAPGWEVTSSVFPTRLAPAGGTGAVELDVYNVGAQQSSGTVTVTDVLPPGVIATQAGDVQGGNPEAIGEFGLWNCAGIGTSTVTCTNSPTNLPHLPIPPGEETSSISAEGSGTIEKIGIAVEVQTSETGTLVNHATVTGGGGAPASTSAPVVVSSTAPSFGFAGSDGWFSNTGGVVDTQAGSHPYEFVFSFDLNTVSRNGTLHPASGEVRNIAVNLPPGFVGNAPATPACAHQAFEEEKCSPSSQIGNDLANANHGELVPFHVPVPVYNLVPPSGVPVQFGLVLFGIRVFLDAGVRDDSDYGVTEHGYDLPQEKVMGNRVTVWGEPSNPLHDTERTSKQVSPVTGEFICQSGCASNAPRVPFLTLPTACEGPQTFTANADIWETAELGSELGETLFEYHSNGDIPTGFTGCDHLGFDPKISTAPDTDAPDAPVGLKVGATAPQEGLTTPGALATSNIKNAAITLSKGVVVNPGKAAGLEACQTSEDGIGTENPPSCPSASKVGTVEVQTPLLKESLQGNVYVLQSNPPDLQVLIAFAAEGVNVKLIAEVTLNESTGQLNAIVVTGIPKFPNIPQFPVSDFKLSFDGGAQAALDTPARCGEDHTTSDFKPWSTPAVPDAFPTSSFAIGSNCPPSPLPFTPTMTAGTTSDQAGAFANFSLLLQRPDDQQRISGLHFQMPPGLLGELSHVLLCTNAQAEANACPEASKIGHTTVESGPGPHPLVVPEPGREQASVYLTETYEGAPFGLSIVVPLHVGPFTLPTQRVRAKIEVDPRTGQLTVTTNPLPQIVAGVPTDLREISAVVDRPEFIINPTNCDPSSFSGTATGTPPPASGGSGATAAISSPFRMGSCRSLGFSPKLVANASGKTSKAMGASLSATLSFPATPPGTGQATDQANVHSIKVELPKQLPSRLTTLQKACTAAQFNLNPAGCPPASDVGQAVAHTPVLPVPLSGPAYFVSHGGEAFPELVLLLQGYGVQIIVEATTFISKAGVTSLTFKAAPDAPVNSFTLTSPEGPNSILTANGNLCTSKLTMPTELVGQNGAVLHQTTKIAVTGCPKTKTLTRAQKLAAALKACHKDKKKAKRKACERQAHKKYGPTKTKKTKKKK